MIEVKNLLFQPLSLHTRSGRGLHLGPRQVLRLPGDDVSAEMQAAARRGAVSLTPANAECGTRNAELETQESAIPQSEIRNPQSAARVARRKRS
ncbi:MAG TPA: hypothetical protein PKZ25_12805 [Candidatus Hydrogenedentes bacterium]|nr:hypothetical protein [Candidatus Hydrogenedentota bacterium]